MVCPACRQRLRRPSRAGGLHPLKRVAHEGHFHTRGDYRWAIEVRDRDTRFQGKGEGLASRNSGYETEVVVPVWRGPLPRNARSESGARRPIQMRTLYLGATTFRGSSR